VPAISQLPGFQSGVWLPGIAAGRGLSLTIWDTEANARTMADRFGPESGPQAGATIKRWEVREVAATAWHPATPLVTASRTLSGAHGSGLSCPGGCSVALLGAVDGGAPDTEEVGELGGAVVPCLKQADQVCLLPGVELGLLATQSSLGLGYLHPFSGAERDQVRFDYVDSPGLSSHRTGPGGAVPRPAPWRVLRVDRGIERRSRERHRNVPPGQHLVLAVPVHHVDNFLGALCSQAGLGRLLHLVGDSEPVKTVAMTRGGAAASMAASITALSALTACSGWSSSINVADAGGHRLLAHTRTPSAAASASLQGPLTLSSDLCLGVGAGADFVVVFFPAGTGWRTPTTIVVDGKTLNVGDNIALGGGVSDSTDARGTVQRYCPSSTGHIWDTG